jgi:anti-anti-sigma factor
MIHVLRVGVVTVLKPRAAMIGEGLSACKRHLQDQLQNLKSRLIFDFSEVPLIQSEGLEFLVEAQQACLQQGGSVAICAPNELCKEVLSICGLQHSIGIFPDLRSALSEFAR